MTHKVWCYFQHYQAIIYGRGGWMRIQWREFNKGRFDYHDNMVASPPVIPQP